MSQVHQEKDYEEDYDEEEEEDDNNGTVQHLFANLVKINNPIIQLDLIDLVIFFSIFFIFF